MDNTIETILAFLLSVIIFFIFPIYVAYEKKDDLAYAVTTKYVSDFVEEVKIKGYISTDMYQKFLDKLSTTGNTYDIYLEHKANRIYPKLDKDGKVASYQQITEIFTEKQILPVIFDIDRDGDLVPKTYTNEKGEREDLIIYRKIKDVNISGVKTVSYENMKIEDLPYKPNVFYIEDQDGNKEYIYAMNIGDEFSMRVKNNNISIAASLFNSFSTNSVKADTTRVYVNYGAIITSEKYWN